MRGCRKCLDAGYDISLGAIFTGVSIARVMIIGQAPGASEVTAKRPFNAGSGRRLFKWLFEAGWEESNFRNSQYMTAVTKCYPGKNSSGRGDRVPSRAEQSLCRPFLNQEIILVNPHLIIPVGTLAIRLFHPSNTKLKKIIGSAHYFPPRTLSNRINFDLNNAIETSFFNPDYPRDGRWLVPLPHPSGASTWPNMPENRALISRAIALLRDIREAWNL